MKELRFSSQFKKDFKRFRNYPDKVMVLNDILGYFMRGEEVPAEHKPHKLKGLYRGCMECHVESDYLLIWKDETTGAVYLVRLGSHSELFS